MVHVLFVGCCGVSGCPCRGIDGVGNRCKKDSHERDCNYWEERPTSAPPTALQRIELRKQREISTDEYERIVAFKRQGLGKRSIARMTGIPISLVTAVLQQTFGVGPSTTPRARPDQQQQVALGTRSAESRMGEGQTTKDEP